MTSSWVRTNSSTRELVKLTFFTGRLPVAFGQSMPMPFLSARLPRTFLVFRFLGVGDFNGDGFDDVIGGGGVRSGRAYTFFGPLSGTIAAADADFIVTGQASDQVCLSVAGMDLNGDGTGDVIVGAPQFSDQDPEYTAIYFGSREEAFRIRLRPRDPPIVIPPEGGSFRYNLDLINESDISRTIDVWIMIVGPGLNRTVESFSRTLTPGARFHRTFTQTVPGTTSAGTYTVVGNAGTFPVPEVRDRFRFEKL